MEDKAVACGEIWSAASPGEHPLSEEERLRGGDRKIEACLLVKTLRVSDAEKVAEVLAGEFPKTEIGVLSATLRNHCQRASLNVKLSRSCGLSMSG